MPSASAGNLLHDGDERQADEELERDRAHGLHPPGAFTAEEVELACIGEPLAGSDEEELWEEPSSTPDPLATRRRLTLISSVETTTGMESTRAMSICWSGVSTVSPTSLLSWVTGGHREAAGRQLVPRSQAATWEPQTSSRRH